MAEGALAKFLGYGTELFTWVVTNAMTLIEKMMENPYTACSLIVSLIGLIFVTFRMIKSR